jgi:peroxiredoxin Q/BCP
MVEVGAKAPEFTLTSDKGEEVHLSDFRGEPVVLYFYPKADTPGCTKQACAIRDTFPKIEMEDEDEDVTVIGISPDPPEALVKFREKYDLPFILLSDPDHEVAEAYGAWGEKKVFGKTREGIIRSHLAIDEEGRITERKHNVKPESTAKLVLKVAEI